MDPNAVQNPGQSEDAANNAPSNDQDFDAALDAAISAHEGTPADDAAVNLGQDDGQQGTVDQDPAPADAAAQAPGADGTPSPQGSATDDPWANAPPELREAFEKEKRDWELRFRSANGRVSAYQRQLAQYQQQTQQQPAQQQAHEQQQEVTHRQDAGASGIDLKDPKFQQMREDFPEVAGPLLDLLDVVVGRLDQVSKTTGSVEQQQAEAFLASQEQALAQQHPDWLVAASDDRFGGWLQEQPISIQQAFERNREAIVDSRDASLVISLFKQSVGFSSPQQQPQQQAPTQDPRRQRQLASGRDVGRTAPPVATGIAEHDFDAHLDAAIAKLERSN